MLNVPGLTYKRIHTLFYSVHKIESLAQLVEMDLKEINKIFDELGFNMSKSEKDQFFAALKGLPVMGIEYSVSEDKKEENLWEEDTVFSPGSIVPIKITIEKMNKLSSKRPMFNKTGGLLKLDFGSWLAARRMTKCWRLNDSNSQIGILVVLR